MAFKAEYVCEINLKALNYMIFSETVTVLVKTQLHITFFAFNNGITFAIFMFSPLFFIEINRPVSDLIESDIFSWMV